MLPKLCRIRNVVYKIHCKDCDVSYVGQTKRQIKIRIKEHRNNIKLNETCGNHWPYIDTFDWEDIKIMDSESNYNERLISEFNS